MLRFPTLHLTPEQNFDEALQRDEYLLGVHISPGSLGDSIAPETLVPDWQKRLIRDFQFEFEADGIGHFYGGYDVEDITQVLSGLERLEEQTWTSYRNVPNHSVRVEPGNFDLSSFNGDFRTALRGTRIHFRRKLLDGFFPGNLIRNTGIRAGFCEGLDEDKNKKIHELGIHFPPAAFVNFVKRFKDRYGKPLSENDGYGCMRYFRSPALSPYPIGQAQAELNKTGVYVHLDPHVYKGRKTLSAVMNTIDPELSAPVQAPDWVEMHSFLSSLPDPE